MPPGPKLAAWIEGKVDGVRQLSDAQTLLALGRLTIEDQLIIQHTAQHGMEATGQLCGVGVSNISYRCKRIAGRIKSLLRCPDIKSLPLFSLCRRAGHDVETSRLVARFYWCPSLVQLDAYGYLPDHMSNVASRFVRFLRTQEGTQLGMLIQSVKDAYGGPGGGKGKKGITHPMRIRGSAWHGTYKLATDYGLLRGSGWPNPTGRLFSPDYDTTLPGDTI